MNNCPNCAKSLPDEASFCPDCGESLEHTCRNCGESVPARANFCPNCREEIATTTDGNEQRTAGDGPFRLKPREFAHRLDESQLSGGGFFAWLNRRREVEIEAGNLALFLKNGKLAETLGPGRHTLDTLSQQIKDFRRSNDVTAVLVEDRDTAVDIAVDDIRTASEYPVTVYVEFVFAIDDHEQFVTSLLADRDAVTAETFETILGPATEDELQATLSNYEREELYGNRELKRELRQDVEQQCRSTLSQYGLRLVDLRSFDYDDDRDEIREERKTVEIRKEKEDIKDEKADLDRRGRERETGDKVHAENQRVRRQTAEQSADHEIETQDIEHDHEKDDMQRRHKHKAERETVEHQEEKQTTRKEKEVERRELEHEQDVDEIADLMDLKKKKDMDSLDVDEREQGMEMQRDEHEVEVEKERLQARDEVDLDTVASLDDVDDDVSELAKMDKAEDLTPEQLDSLGAQDSDELAKARQEAKNAEKERERVEDQKEFREEVKEMAEDSMDRIQETSESAMNNMGETGKAAADDTSDNVIVSDTGSSDSGDTTIVQGGSGDGGDDRGSDESANRVVVCPECETEVSPDDGFCLNCGTEI
jgi:hypothetical protein